MIVATVAAIAGLSTVKGAIFHLAKDMVSLQTTKKATANLISAGKQLVLYSIRQHYASIDTSDDDEPGSNQSIGLQEAVRRKKNKKHIESTEYLVHNWIESWFVRLQLAILWHDPLVSLGAIGGLLLSFLLLTYIAPRFYATLLLSLFVYNLTKMWFKHVWPEIRLEPDAEQETAQRLDLDRFTYLHPHVLSLDEFGQIVDTCFKTLQHHLLTLLQLRSEKPLTFCVSICTLFACTAYIGNQISGFTIVISALALIFTLPGIYLRFISDDNKLKLKQTLDSWLSNVFVAASKATGGNLEASPVLPSPDITQLPVSQAVVTEQNIDTSSTPQPPLATNTACQAPDCGSQQQRKQSVDLSSATDESTSLIDADEDEDDQDGGFVIL